MKKQVEKEHYEFLKYVNKDRFMSFYYQLKYIYEINPKNVLEIGVGNNFLKKILSNEIKYTTLDFDSSLSPDIVGSVTNIPFKDNSFDLVVCFQVLEHLPFEQFEEALKELARVSKKNVIISLPFSSIYLKFEIKIPILKKLQFSFTIPQFLRKHIFDGQHYWEIGKRGYSIKAIKKIIKKYFKIIEVNNPYENKYHVFLILEKKLI